MSNRFHNKLHRQNHHSNPTPNYPDSALDPIASFEQPFQGEFYSQGDIITTQNLSATLNLNVGGDSTLLGTVKSPNIGTGEDNSVVILNSSGFLKTDEINPQVWDTTAKFVSASDGALTVNRLTKATDSIGINESIVYDNGTNVGIDTDTPGAKLTVKGTLSSNSTVNFGGIGTGTDNSVVILDANGFLRTDEINPVVWDTTSKFVSASDGALTVNRLTKATDSLGINESIIWDSGTNVGIGTDVPNAKLDVNGDAIVQTDLTVKGNFTVLGTTSQLDTLVYATSAVNITNAGTGPALTVTQTGSEPIAHFIDSNGDDIIFDNNGYVGLGIAIPTEKLDISGNVKTTGTATIGTLTDNATGTSVVVQTAGLLQKRTLNVAAFDTTSKFVSASDGALTVNRLTKATDSNGINESIVWDSGTNVGIGTDTPGAKLTISGTISSSSTVNFGGIGTGTDNSVVILDANGFLRTDEINPQIWDTTAKFVSASDGALTVNRLTKATDSNGINESIVTDDGASVSVGGNLSTTGTATIGTIADSLTNTSVVVQTAGLLQKRTLNVAAFDTTSKFVSATDGNLDAGYIPVAENALGLDSSIIYQNASNNIGIGTTNPGAKLTISGTISSSSTVNFGGIGTGTDNSVVILDANGFLRTDEIDSRVWGSSLVDGTGTANKVTKWLDANTVTDSIVTDDGALVSVGGNLSTTGTATIGTIADSLTNTSVVVQTAGLLQKRTLNVAAFDTTSKYVSASDGALTVNRLTKATNTNGINESIVWDSGTNVGIDTDTPGAKLTVKGTLSSSSTVNFGGIGTGTDNSVVILDANGFLRTDEINPVVWDTTAKFVSASDGALTVNRLTKATDSNGINESIVTDDGSLVSVGGNLSTTGTATIGTLATGTVDSVLIESSGLVQKRTIDSRAWGSSLVDGTGTANRVAYWTDSNTIAADDDFFFNGTNVGIGTTNPGAKLTIQGTLSSSSTVNFGGIGTGTDNSVVVLDSSGFLKTDEIDSRVWGSSLVDGTGTANYLAKWSDSDTLTNSIVYEDSVNFRIGISDATPEEKLDVDGNIRSTGLIIPGSSTVTPTTTTALPTDNDVIFNNQTGAVTITGFSSGRAGVTYTLTNKSTHEVTLSSSANLFVRGGSTWAGYKCSANPSGKIELPQNFSCSLRMDSTTSGSVW